MQTHKVVLRHRNTGEWWYFFTPQQVIVAEKLDEILPALRETEELVNTRNWYAAGFLSYEAAPAFDSSMPVHAASGLPLLSFGLYDAPVRSNSLSFDKDEYLLPDWKPNISRDQYRESIEKIRTHIAQGKTYQTNFTFQLQSQFAGSPEALFVDMVDAQSAGYFAYVDTGRFKICSASPELFFQLDQDRIICKPMKGTVKRGRTLAEDQMQSAWLRASEKNRAENVMIVDMIRNDLGRIAEIGSVKTPILFEAEQYRTLWQMTSTVTATVKKPFAEIVSNLFPCASITGAPKVSTMKIISELEAGPRGIYTGCIGYLAPGREAQFNVAIRTVTIDRENGQATYGVGGGVVWDSTERDEFEEALLKAKVVTQRHPKFNLFETLRWSPKEGYYLLERHLARLRDSASYFRFIFAHEAVSAYLKNLAANFSMSTQRVHLELAPDGKLNHAVVPLDLKHGLFRAALAKKAISSQDIYLFHKTTYRDMYVNAFDPSVYDDVLLFNERTELTEFTIGNLVVQAAGKLYTPPVDCGLLGGTLRAELLEQGMIKEKVLRPADLAISEKIYLINSVRGWVEVNWAG